MKLVTCFLCGRARDMWPYIDHSDEMWLYHDSELAEHFHGTCLKRYAEAANRKMGIDLTPLLEHMGFEQARIEATDHLTSFKQGQFWKDRNR